MKYRIVGQNRDSGARMMLEMEAESKAAAERKALSQGMTVNHVEDITNGYSPKASAPNPRAGRRNEGGAGKFVALLLIVVVAILIFMYRNAIRHALHI